MIQACIDTVQITVKVNVDSSVLSRISKYRAMLSRVLFRLIDGCVYCMPGQMYPAQYIQQ